jgi:hypothetical protein
MAEQGRKDGRTEWDGNSFREWRLQLIKERHQELILKSRENVLDDFLEDDDEIDELDVPSGYGETSEDPFQMSEF